MSFFASRRVRATGLVMAAALLAGLLVLPAFGDGPPDADHLRMTDVDGDLFFYGGADPGPTTTNQFLDTNKCVVKPANSSGPLVELGSKTGIFDHGMGIKSGGATGTPCSETSGSEVLSITSKNAWYKLRLDVEAKGNAWIQVDLLDAEGELVQTHELLTGSSIAEWNAMFPDDPNNPSMDLPANPYSATTTSADRVEACADPNDSGPDSNINDNCLWTIEPGEVFTTVEIRIKPGNGGAVSLEGGGDYESAFPTRFANGEFDSLFFRLGAPNAVNDDDYEVDEDNTLNVNATNGVLANDTDPLDQSLTASLDTDVSNGSLTLNSDGSFTYTPDANFNGTDTFKYVASAGGLTSDPATVTITVNPLNDNPVAIEGPIDAVEDETSTYTGDDLGNDVDGDDLTVVSATATSGTAEINEDGELEYTPAEDFCGTAELEIEFTISDGNGGTATATVDVEVACQADDDSYEMDERIQQGGTGILNTLTVPSFGVLENDSNSPGDLTPSVKTAPTTGTLNLSSDGSFTYDPAARTWVGDETSYDVTWEYQYGAGEDIQSAMVTITINRNLCQTDTVTDVGEKVSGSFTLISSEGCKNWVPVVADDEEETVLFQPDSPDTTGIYEGVVTIFDLVVEDGELASVVFKYDPAGGEAFVPVPSCVGTEESPALPGAAPGWCFYDIEPTLTGSNAEGQALWSFAWYVYGEDDPKFSFK